ncbi:hypothetical protein [Thiomicrospira sp.]|uniref:phosphorylase family protein n=1 Tax=Thiomicrospira sp. TaxID=935 RepID=UPI002F923126
MEILLIEDSIDKIDNIKQVIEKTKELVTFNFTICSDLNCAKRHLYSTQFDLIIFDFYLPISEQNATLADVSLELIEDFSKSKNYDTKSLAITGYDLHSIENIDKFNIHGVTVVQYLERSKEWQLSLERIVKRVISKPKFDFLIFCALTKERMAYRSTSAEVGNLINVKGLNCQEISIGSLKGLCIVPPRMGPVNTAISVAKAIDYFQPSLVTMSGICAGFPGEVGLLDIVVADTVWDYSVGKVTDKGFKSEPYQQQIDNDLKVRIQQMIEEGTTLAHLKEGLQLPKNYLDFQLRIGPVVSGSAVIASSEKMIEISAQHRKVMGLEMEISSLYEAATQSPRKPLFLAAKSVVDVGDTNKNDTIHEPACLLSAKFIVKVVESFSRFQVN